jgi:hypothetical protein
MRRLTQKRAIELHRELWDWLSKNPRMDKEDWPGFKKFGYISNYCWLCEYHVTHKRGYCNKNCLLDWSGVKGGCLWDNGEFSKWQGAKSKKGKIKWAKIIRDLPVRRRE